MALGKETFGLNKTEFNEKLSRILRNFRANSKLIGEPREFVIWCCKLTERWSKLANDPEVMESVDSVDEIAAAIEEVESLMEARVVVEEKSAQLDKFFSGLIKAYVERYNEV